MTSKERMMRALHREKPDRMPVTIHQWQKYHLDHYMDGMDALSAFKACGLDASIAYFGTVAQSQDVEVMQYPEWREEIVVVKDDPEKTIKHHTITTPGGQLTFKTGANRITEWMIEYPIKKQGDIELIDKYMPVPELDQADVARVYDEVGDAGILRGFVWGYQVGPWQHAAGALVPLETLILETFDNPDWVHRLLRMLLDKKLRFIEESLKGAKFDLIETGGGAGSDTVISPGIHHEFCLPYDRQIHRALHDVGHICAYHTCGGMMHILDLILENESDASETLAPPGVGGNVTDPEKVREVFGGKLAMIGGMDQFNILTSGTVEQIRAEVERLFEGFGPGGGYIMSPSDHFFETPPENLQIYADAASECRYR